MSSLVLVTLMHESKDVVHMYPEVAREELLPGPIPRWCTSSSGRELCPRASCVWDSQPHSEHLQQTPHFYHTDRLIWWRPIMEFRRRKKACDPKVTCVNVWDLAVKTPFTKFCIDSKCIFERTFLFSDRLKRITACGNQCPSPSGAKLRKSSLSKFQIAEGETCARKVKNFPCIMSKKHMQTLLFSLLLLVFPQRRNEEIVFKTQNERPDLLFSEAPQESSFVQEPPLLVRTTLLFWEQKKSPLMKVSKFEHHSRPLPIWKP